jgi:hypothetical protein
MPGPTPSFEQHWQEFVAADLRFVAARANLLRTSPSDTALIALLRRALATVAQRASALRLLLSLAEPLRHEVLPDLVDLAASLHRDTMLVREVILSLDRQWLEAYLPHEIEQVLATCGDPYSAYLRLAELLSALRSPYLATLINQAAASERADIREISEDFGTDG